MKRRILSIAICLCLLIALLPTAVFGAEVKSAAAFTDVAASKWYAPYVEYIAAKGLMTGTSETKFSPESAVTRAQYVQVLYALAGKPAASKSTQFTDLKKGAYYENAVAWAAETGVTSGMTKTTFAPDRKVTREQAATFFKAYAEKIAKVETTETDTLAAFPDKSSVSNYAVSSMQWAVGAKLISGVKSGKQVLLAPKATLTRAQLATMLKAFDEYLLGKAEKSDDKDNNKSDSENTNKKDNKPEKNDNNKTDNNTDKTDNKSDNEDTNTAIDEITIKDLKGEIEKFDNGDTVFNPDEKLIVVDDEQGIRYYKNIIDVYTLTDLTIEETKELEELVDGIAITDISGIVNMLQLYVDAESLSELNTLSEKIMENENVLYAAYTSPIELSNNTITDPWSDDSSKPESDIGNENVPNGRDWWAEAIRAYSAWDIIDELDLTTSTTVGIVDDGFDLAHEDLDGKITFPVGRNYYRDKDDGMHGTHVAGIIAAKHNNIGIRGISDNSNLLCLDYSQKYSNLVNNGIYVAATKLMIEKGAQVINNSWGNDIYSKENEDWIDQLIEQYKTYRRDLKAEECIIMIAELIMSASTHEDFIICQSAGNGYIDNGEPIDAFLNGSYCTVNEDVFNALPKTTKNKLNRKGIAYSDIKDHIMVVGAVKNSAEDGAYLVWESSNYGDAVDIYAPGDHVYSTVKNDLYESHSGTSMACPIVAGCAAVLWTVNQDLSAKEVKEILINSGSRKVRENVTGKLKPMVDLYAAILDAKPSLKPSTKVKAEWPKKNIKDVVAGSNVSFVICNDGTAYTSLSNDEGVKLFAEDIQAISNHQDLFLTNDGSAWTFYDNFCNFSVETEERWGVSTDIFKQYNTKKVLENVKIITGGHVGESIGSSESFYAAIKKDGSLWMWGDNGWGQIGDGTYKRSDSPVKVMDNVKSVSCGYGFTAAVKTDGTLWMWGQSMENTPKQYLEDVSCVSNGSHFCAALKNDGSLWTRSIHDSNYGELGRTDTYNNRQFVQILDNVSKISMGEEFGAAIKKDGSLWMWGNNEYGQIGDGQNDVYQPEHASWTTTNVYVPKEIMKNVKAVSCSKNHTIAVTNDDKLYVWGNNSSGQFGSKKIENATTPQKVN